MAVHATGSSLNPAPNTASLDTALSTAYKSGNSTSISSALQAESDAYYAGGMSAKDFNAHIQGIETGAGVEPNSSAAMQTFRVELDYAKDSFLPNLNPATEKPRPPAGALSPSSST